MWPLKNLKFHKETGSNETWWLNINWSTGKFWFVRCEFLEGAQLCCQQLLVRAFSNWPRRLYYCGSGQTSQRILFPNDWLNWFLWKRLWADLTYGGHLLPLCFICVGEETGHITHLAHLWRLLKSVVTQMYTFTKPPLGFWQSNLDNTLRSGPW